MNDKVHDSQLREQIERLIALWDAMSYDEFDEMRSINADVVIAVRAVIETYTGVWDKEK